MFCCWLAHCFIFRVDVIVLFRLEERSCLCVGWLVSFCCVLLHVLFIQFSRWPSHPLLCAIPETDCRWTEAELGPGVGGCCRQPCTGPGNAMESKKTQQTNIPQLFQPPFLYLFVILSQPFPHHQLYLFLVLFVRCFMLSRSCVLDVCGPLQAPQ